MDRAFETIWNKKTTFFGMFFLVFSLSYLVLTVADFLPEAPGESEGKKKELVFNIKPKEISEIESEKETPKNEEVVITPNATAGVNEENPSSLESLEAIPVEKSPLPIKMVIDKLNKEVFVSNPTSRLVSDLDAALLDGAVRHPDSATLQQDGNVFLLGHSSYLPVVRNKNYKAFNGIQNLEWGDTIKIYSEDSVYTYRVEKVYRALAQDITVPIAGTGKILTLVTCNSFGSIEDRYVVESKLVKVEPI